MHWKAVFWCTGCKQFCGIELEMVLICLNITGIRTVPGHGSK